MQPERPRSILKINTRDIGGGAEKIARELFETYRSRGHHAAMAVGYKHGDDPDVFTVPNEQTGRAFSRLCWRMHRRLQPHYGRWWGSRRLCRAVHRLASPRSALDVWRGREDFRFPGSRLITRCTDHRPDIIHAHNLHGNYFDLRALPQLSRRFPFVLTLHDAWPLSGHCAHSLECDRWRTGCGNCPDLTIYPAVRRDSTAANWQIKRFIYSQCRLYVSTPCEWLMEKVQASILAPAIVDSRVIPYGVDLPVFRPGDRRAARAELDLPKDAIVLLFAANSVRSNTFKDYTTMRDAVSLFSSKTARGFHTKILFLALGEDAPAERIGDAVVRFVPFTHDSRVVARFLQAADLYVHASLADTYPVTVLEALACGTPVVATAVGGIPEQIRSLPPCDSSRSRHREPYYTGNATGILTPAGNSGAMTAAIARLTQDDVLRQNLGHNAAQDAKVRFDLRRHADDYLRWYEELLAATEMPAAGRATREPASCAHVG